MLFPPEWHLTSPTTNPVSLHRTSKRALRHCSFACALLSCRGGSNARGTGYVDRNDFTITRVVIDTLAMLMLVVMVVKELKEIDLRRDINSYHRRRTYQMITHPTYGIAHKSYLSARDYEHLVRAVAETHGNGLFDGELTDYFNDVSNWVDILSLSTLAISTVLQVAAAVVDGYADNDDAVSGLTLTSATLLSIGLILAWYNLLKFFRAFDFMGTFMATMEKIIKDVGVFLVFFMTVWFPFALVYMLFFGGSEIDSEGSYSNLLKSLFNTFKLAMVDGPDMDSDDSVRLKNFAVLQSD